MPERAPKPVPEGMNTVTAHLWFNGNCGEAVKFYRQAFDAQLTGPVVNGPDGKSVRHAMIRFGDTNIMMADAWPGQWERGPEESASAGFWVYVDDCDGLYEQAVEAGCEVVDPMMDAFWGDRMGKVNDPFGHCWEISSHKWVLTPEEMNQKQEEWQKSVSG